MNLGRWLSRKIGSYSIDLKVADEVIKDIMHSPPAIKFMNEVNDYRQMDKVMMKLIEPFKITDPQYYEAFMEKWEEYKKRIFEYEFDKKREKYT